MQRLLDILFSISAIIILFPLFFILIIVLRLTGEGEVFFFQERVGKGGKVFKVIKFATMIKESPLIGTGTITLKNDYRVLPIGKFLRKLKINELPQVINVLLGDMSIVGPRPQTRMCFEAFPRIAQDYIIKVRPGISGIGSLVFHDEESIISTCTNPIGFYNNSIAHYKGELEIWYVQNKDLYIYFKIICLTLWIVFFPTSNLVWKVFNNLPIPPNSLKATLKYS